MKKRWPIILIMSLFLTVWSVSANTDGRWDYGGTPMQVLDSVVGVANVPQSFQETAMDPINNQEGSYQSEYRVSNTLDWVRMHMATYLQWIVYFGLTIAVILLIYNGFLMVTHSVTKSWDFSKVKKNIQYIAIGVIILTSFYAILRLVIGLINSVFGTNSSGDTWF